MRQIEFLFLKLNINIKYNIELHFGMRWVYGLYPVSYIPSSNRIGHYFSPRSHVRVIFISQMHRLGNDADGRFQKQFP